MINISRVQVIIIVLVCLLGLFFAAPNLVSKETDKQIPGWLPSQQFNLGLDLQGGAHLLFEVNMQPVIDDQFKDLVGRIRSTFRSSDWRIRYVQPRVNEKQQTVTVRLIMPDDPAKAQEARDKASRALRSIIRDVSSSGNLFSGGSQRYEFTIADNGLVTIRFTQAGVRELRNRVLDQSIEVIRRRVDETGTKEPTIQRQGDDRILVQVPGVKDPEQLKTIIGTTAKMTFHLVDHSVEPGPNMKVPPGSELLPSEDKGESKVLVYKEVALDGSHLVDAGQSFQDGRPVVTFRFDTEGSKKFCDITRRNLKKRFAIVLDNKVLSAPSIEGVICGGSGIIYGNFTVQSATNLSILLRAGALPAPLKIVEERTVGAELGADSIEAGKLASAVGLVLVVVFMFLAYGRFGLMADVALFFNLVLIAAALSLLQATLTLPGIAGIVLTIGMAVDANVLIFERIREEVRAGRTPMSAIDTGYRRALTTIIDSNLTTFIAALLLFLFGSGPVQGFGVTLAIGLATSMFTAIMVTRLFVIMWWRRKRPATLPI
jgi:preprotein translocase subunit SecD